MLLHFGLVDFVVGILKFLLDDLELVLHLFPLPFFSIVYFLLLVTLGVIRLTYLKWVAWPLLVAVPVLDRVNYFFEFVVLYVFTLLYTVHEIFNFLILTGLTHDLLDII